MISTGNMLQGEAAAFFTDYKPT